jgi:hypothetical protein
VIDPYAEIVRPVFEPYGDHDEEKYHSEDHPPSHRRSSDFFGMQLRELYRFSDESLFADLLPEVVSIEKSYIVGYDTKRDDAGYDEVEQEKCETICHI